MERYMLIAAILLSVAAFSGAVSLSDAAKNEISAFKYNQNKVIENIH